MQITQPFATRFCTSRLSRVLAEAAVALLIWCLATMAVAGSNEPGCHCDLTIPKCDGGFRFAVTKLYFSPYLSNMRFAQLTEGDNVKKISVEPNYEPGVRVELAYCFPGTGNDFVMGYQHHDWYNNKRIAGQPGLEVLRGSRSTPPYLFSTALLSPQNFAKAEYHIEQHLMDFEFGQAVNIGDRVTVRFHGGLRYSDTHLRYNAFVFFEVPEGGFLAGDMFKAFFDSDFHGIGPRTGIDCYWHLGAHFDLLSKLSTAMLIGDSENRVLVKEVANPPIIEIFQWRNFKGDNNNCVIANLDLRLAARYSFLFSNNSELGLEAGYRANMFMAIDGKWTMIPALGQPAACAHDFSYHGLYFRVDYAV